MSHIRKNLNTSQLLRQHQKIPNEPSLQLEHDEPSLYIRPFHDKVDQVQSYEAIPVPAFVESSLTYVQHNRISTFSDNLTLNPTHAAVPSPTKSLEVDSAELILPNPFNATDNTETGFTCNTLGFSLDIYIIMSKNKIVVYIIIVK